MALNKLEQLTAYRNFLDGLEELKLEDKFPNVYISLFDYWKIREEKNRIDKLIKIESCEHKETEEDYGRDSHYSYEITKCSDCGKQLKSVKV